MKKLLALTLLFLLLPVKSFSEDEPTLCTMDMSQYVPDPIPNYLQPWWNNVRTGKFAVVYVDFPDGRYINDTDTLQPFYDYQLEWVRDHGVLDAAGEMGIVLEETNIHAGNKYVKASKYSWFDRWNMFFDSLGVYFGTAHPDNISNGDTAFGSFKQYWKEASNGKFEVIPYLTHPNETNYKLKTGIVNDYQMINGVPVIKCVTLPKKKYGSSDLNSYFRNDTDYISSTANNMTTDAISAIDSQINSSNFNLQEFLNDKGILFVYFAGSHRAFKDETIHPQISPIRLRENFITDPDSRIDGFGVSAHQYGHLQFGWAHTNSGRCDIMNGGDVHDNNSPQLPNPVYRMLQGWLQPIALDLTQEIELPPVENSYQCGVVTIYGKPSAAPDWSTGECYIVENRRRMGFDRTIIEKGILNQNFPNFKGGLLIWHYSPYFELSGNADCGVYDHKIKFLHNDTANFLCQSRGNARTFFAWDEFTNSQFYNFDSSETRSGADLQTGIAINDIAQVDYSSLNSDVRFDLNYLISEPTVYNDVIFFRDYNEHFMNDSGKVFYHYSDPAGFYNLKAGTVVESPGGESQLLHFKGLEAKGTESFPIIFQGVGYANEKTKFMGLTFNGLSSYSIIDSLILKNITFKNLNDNLNIIEVGYVSGEINAIPITLDNLNIPYDSSYRKITIQNSTIAKLSISRKDIFFVRKLNINGCVNIDSSVIKILNPKIIFDGPNSFLSIKNSSVNEILYDTSSNGLIFKNGAYINAHETIFNSSSIWNGLKFENSGIDSIMYCTFNNAKAAISIYDNYESSFNSRVIKNNIINVPLDGDYKGIDGENNFRITIQNNIFNMPVNPISSKNVFGVYLKNNNAEGVESLPEENEPPTSPYSMYIINNTFNNGSASIVLLNYTSSFLPFYIKGNIFNSAKVTGLIGRSISGTIKDNVTSNNNIPIGIHLITSSPDVFNNAISSKNVSLHTIGSSYPNLAPVVLGNNLLWRGGKNRFSSLESDNIQLVNAGNVYTNLGENRFQIIDTLPDRYHIYGWVDTTVKKYFARNNCWYPGNNPRINLRRIYTSEPIVTETGITTIDCDREIDPNGWIVDYLGNGVYDTIKQSSDTSGSNLTEEELLYNQGQNYIAASMFIEGISALKNLTDTYNYFYDLPASVYDLYSCYEYLDTNSDQDYRNTLYGNLKIYLEDKIEYGDYDAEFFSNAYNITLMCDVNMGEYDDAANGYEFISLFHPDPDIRLNASWDYAEVEALMSGGNAGGEKQLQITNYKLRIEELKEIKEINIMNEIISNDPVMRKMKESFEKTSKDRKEKQLKENSSSNENGKEYSVKPELLFKENESDKFKSDKAKRNIFELKNLNEQDLEKRRIEDMLLSAKDIRNEKDKTQTLRIPLEYKLYQNYPNPFNPSTKINYSIPESGIVTIKIYDILGKEIQTLVNELKQAGSYEAEFYGKDLSSGVYFVRMESGDFMDIKRMVLIK